MRAKYIFQFGLYVALFIIVLIGLIVFVANMDSSSPIFFNNELWDISFAMILSLSLIGLMIGIIRSIHKAML